MVRARRKSSAAKQANAKKSVSSNVYGHEMALLETLAQFLEAKGLQELELESRDVRVVLRRPGSSRGDHSSSSSSSAPVVSQNSSGAAGGSILGQSAGTGPASSKSALDRYHKVKSPFVGTFYSSPNPQSPSFVQVGQVVEKGKVLCIVEAMKVMNGIESDLRGKIVSCLVENGQVVEFGTPLFLIDPASS